MLDEENKNDKKMSEKLSKDNTFSEEFSEKDDQSREEHSKIDSDNTVEEQLSPKKRKGNNCSLNKS